MKRYNRTNTLLFAGILAAAAAGLLGCAAEEQQAAGTGPPETPPAISGIGGAYPLVEGLHVTGTPVDIDIDTYRLTVTGKVDQPLSLSYEEIKAMEAKRAFVTLDCPGFFTDQGNWTGVPIAAVLDLAGVQAEAEQLHFVAADGNYTANLKIDDALGEGMLIAYAFEDKPLPKVHGYPLRVVAKDQQGNRWVKWLGRIEVR
jgi:DMSO/TMAO reductase YedYZ molybdopterin-dependent catalytic subunit